MNALRTIFRYWLALMALAVVVQIAFAGYGAFDAADQAGSGMLTEDAFDDSFGPHAALAYLIILGGLLLFLLSLAARVGRRRVLQSLGVFALLIVQMLLGWTGADAPFLLGALHPLNAVLILGWLGELTFREFRGERAVGARPATPTPPPT